MGRAIVRGVLGIMLIAAVYVGMAGNSSEKQMDMSVLPTEECAATGPVMVTEPEETMVQQTAETTSPTVTVPTETAVPETTAAPVETTVPTTTAPAETTVPVQTAAPETLPPETAAPVEIPEPAPDAMADALFIGDSRTVGLADYAKFPGADYFAYVGMTVYNVHDQTLPVPSVGRVTLKELLNQKQYGKVYLMLGINEAGYPLDQTTRYYERLAQLIREAQPNAEIYLQANLHVAESRSLRDSMINNPVINKINENIAQIAQQQGDFYLDVNEIFDDSTGSLSAELTSDETHLYGKYYAKWADWIAWKTAQLRGE